MSNETRNLKQENRVSSCEEMMEKMMSQGWEGCDCGEVMSQVMEHGEIPEEWLGMMSWMMETCCGEASETVETSTQDTTQAV